MSISVIQFIVFPYILLMTCIMRLFTVNKWYHLRCYIKWSVSEYWLFHNSYFSWSVSEYGLSHTCDAAWAWIISYFSIMLHRLYLGMDYSFPFDAWSVSEHGLFNTCSVAGLYLSRDHSFSVMLMRLECILKQTSSFYVTWTVFVRVGRLYLSCYVTWTTSGTTPSLLHGLQLSR